ncbi:MAG: hypothetical protein IT210_15855 [Armatimonadetes bacterium]|nr:hypothetical protein [Armatimonadota bacterium]
MADEGIDWRNLSREEVRWQGTYVGPMWVIGEVYRYRGQAVLMVNNERVWECWMAVARSRKRLYIREEVERQDPEAGTPSFGPKEALDAIAAAIHGMVFR